MLLKQKINPINSIYGRAAKMAQGNRIRRCRLLLEMVRDGSFSGV